MNDAAAQYPWTLAECIAFCANGAADDAMVATVGETLANVICADHANVSGVNDVLAGRSADNAVYVSAGVAYVSGATFPIVATAYGAGVTLSGGRLLAIRVYSGAERIASLHAVECADGQYDVAMPQAIARNAKLTRAALSATNDAIAAQLA